MMNSLDMESVNDHHAIPIGGVDVLFPYPQPYQAQMDMIGLRHVIGQTVLDMRPT